MVEKAVIIHKNIIDEWLKRDEFPVDLELIDRALARIGQIIDNSDPDDIIYVEESASTGFITLPESVGWENSARLFGARAGYCLKSAREVLEEAHIPVVLDNEGCLP
jgi:hypothetical protein